MTQIDTDETAQLSSLLTRLNCDHGVVAPAPSATEAMAIYSIAVRLVELQLARSDDAPPADQDFVLARDVLLGTRRMLRAALARLEPEPEREPAPRLMLIDGGASA